MAVSDPENAMAPAPEWGPGPVGFKYVHDWRGCISDDLRAIWPTFTPEQRLVIAQSAQETADREEWD